MKSISENTSDAPGSALPSYLGLLTGSPDASHFLDVRWRKPGGPMRRRFLSTTRTQSAADLIARLAGENDVYVGVALRDGQVHGGRAALSGAHLAWVESDDPDTERRLGALDCPPTMAVASGTTGHLQLYWLLDRRYPIDEIESANRRLALTLAGDRGCADAARILRPPDTFNHKHVPPHAVTLLVYRAQRRYALAHLTEGLSADDDPPVPESSRFQQRGHSSRLDRELLSVPAVDYVRVLTGGSPNREGKVHCPFHEDSNPSLQLYPDGGFYCFGSGCRKGGTIFDFAARLWGVTPRGVAFLELRNRLAKQFDLDAD